MKKLLALLLLAPALSIAADPRYCTASPIRDPNGRISRDMGEVARFKHEHPCPANHKQSGACPGWAVDHVIPLAVGGCDKIINMQWLPTQIKSCGSEYCKDRWERIIYLRGGK